MPGSRVCTRAWWLMLAPARCGVRPCSKSCSTVPRARRCCWCSMASPIRTTSVPVCVPPIPPVAVTNLARSLEKLQQRGLWVVGTAGEAEMELYDHDLTGPTVLIMGAEGKGMRRLTREHCDYLVKLPMAGSVSSLNVSVATGVCLFEALRQRKVGGKK